MKSFFVLTFLVLSLNAFADIEYYSGNDEGASCQLGINIKDRYASLGNCGVYAKQVVNNGRTIILEGGAEFLDCKIEVTLDQAKIPVEATLSTKHMLKPFYTKKTECTDLKRVR